jgi:phosphotransferase system enzyme I (PtsI)
MAGVLRGIGVSGGVAVGRVHLLHAEPLPVVAEPVPPERVQAEIDAFHRARAAARGELEELKVQVLEALGEAYAGIFEAQRLVLEDPQLADQTERRIRVGRVSARWALKEVVAGLMRRFEGVDDEYIRERGGELTDVQRRLQRLLRGEEAGEQHLPQGPLIVIAHAVGPSDAILLARDEVAGLATDVGGRTSHTAILAQALFLPAVVGLHDVTRRVANGDPVVLDGDTGQVIVSPGPAETAEAERRHREALALESRMVSARDLPAVTRDGAELTIRANVELPGEVERAVEFGARGIGLYRSEFLFLSRAPVLPSEEDHYRAYADMARKMAPHPVVVRTLDLGGEKYFHEVLAAGNADPALGLRGVRFCLMRPDVFRPQVRGLLRAAANWDNLRLMLPLVTSAEEVRRVRSLVAEEAESLRAAGAAARADVPLGIMVEVPGAALAADILAREADFFSLGTNDLIQYALAVDRASDSLAHLYEPLHPGVVRMLFHVVECARRRGVPVAICGEVAADIQALPVLAGLGLREFSVQPRAIGPLRESVRAMSLADAERAARRALDPDAGSAGSPPSGLQSGPFGVS